MKNRFGVNVKKGSIIRFALPRGGFEWGEVSRLDQMPAYGWRANMHSGMSCAIDDVSHSADVRIYDNGGKTADRFTSVYMDSPERQPGMYECIGMSENPFHPQGFGMHSSAMPGAHLGKRIRFDDLPDACKRLLCRDIQGESE